MGVKSREHWRFDCSVMTWNTAFRRSMASFLGGCAVFLIPLLFDPSEGPQTTFLYMSRAAITGSFTVLFIYTPEVYPTAVRSFGLGTSSSYSRLGGLIAPFVVVELVDSGREHIAELILLVMCAIAMVLSLLLPIETAGRDLQETLEVEMTTGGLASANPVYGLPVVDGARAGGALPAGEGASTAKKLGAVFKKLKKKTSSAEGLPDVSVIKGEQGGDARL